MKRELRESLEQKKFEEIAEMAAKRKRTLGALMSLTYDADPLIAWRAAEAQGWAAAGIASTNPEFVRGHLRRLHWLLSEESGGICRHSPQAMAEIVVRTKGMFADYGPITISLLTDMADEDLASGFRAAVLWAIGRLAPVAREDVEAILPEVAKSFGDPDPSVRGLAVWSVVRAGRDDLIDSDSDLAGDQSPFDIYQEGDFITTSTHELLGNS
jgi:hypothetical protein